MSKKVQKRRNASKSSVIRRDDDRCSYVGSTGVSCSRRASSDGKCTLHLRRLADSGTQFYVEFTPLAGYEAPVVRRGPYRAARANQIMAQLASSKQAELTARGYAARQVRA